MNTSLFTSIYDTLHQNMGLFSQVYTHSTKTLVSFDTEMHTFRQMEASQVYTSLFTWICVSFHQKHWFLLIPRCTYSDKWKHHKCIRLFSHEYVSLSTKNIGFFWYRDAHIPTNCAALQSWWQNQSHWYPDHVPPNPSRSKNPPFLCVRHDRIKTLVRSNADDVTEKIVFDVFLSFMTCLIYTSYISVQRDLVRRWCHRKDFVWFFFPVWGRNHNMALRHKIQESCNTWMFLNAMLRFQQSCTTWMFLNAKYVNNTCVTWLLCQQITWLYYVTETRVAYCWHMSHVTHVFFTHLALRNIHAVHDSITWPKQESRSLVTLQHTATHCNTLQHTATHCNTLLRDRNKSRVVCWTKSHVVCWKKRHILMQRNQRLWVEKSTYWCKESLILTKIEQHCWKETWYWCRETSYWCKEKRIVLARGQTLWEQETSHWCRDTSD